MNTEAQTLPQSIQDLLRSEDLMAATEKIAKNHSLQPVYFGALHRATVAILKGEMPPNAYVQKLIYELDVTNVDAVQIAKDINRDIFSPIKEALSLVHAKKGEVEKLDPSLVTCLPGQMSKAAALGNKAPGNAQMGNILEQKLAGSFRIKEGEVINFGSLASKNDPSPHLVVPPLPQVQMPPPQAERPKFIPPSQHPTEPPRIDPYRDHDV